jgi:hypothetical protein
MGLFDMFKDKAAELIQGVKEQVSEVTGIDLQPDTVVDQIGKAAGSVTEAGQNLAAAVDLQPDVVVDQVGQAAGSVTEAGQNLAAAVDLQPDVVVDQVGQAAGSVTEAGQNLAATAEGAVKDATDPLGGN